MADMKDMAYTPAEVKAQRKAYGVEAGDAKTPTYSWGLNIRLEQTELDKLGITDMPEVGAEIYLDVCCKVKSVSQSEDEKDKRSVVELQITKMGIETGTDDKDDTPVPKPVKAATSVAGYYGGAKK